MTYKIESGIPMPNLTRKGRNARYPMGDLNVGESFLVTDAPVKTVRGAVSARNKTKRGKFTAREVEGGVRVWRVN